MERGREKNLPIRFFPQSFFLQSKDAPRVFKFLVPPDLSKSHYEARENGWGASSNKKSIIMRIILIMLWCAGHIWGLVNHPECLDRKPPWRQLWKNGQHQTMKGLEWRVQELETKTVPGCFQQCHNRANAYMGLMTCHKGVEPGSECKQTGPKRLPLNPCTEPCLSQSVLPPGDGKLMAGSGGLLSIFVSIFNLFTQMSVFSPVTVGENVAVKACTC